MSTAEVVGPDRAPELEEEQLPTGLAGLWQRAWLNLRTGNLGPAPIIIGELLVIIIFGFAATNFFTAVNFVDLINQTAGTAMLAFGVVFVLLLGEIDLSIGYLAGIGALVVAELQLPGSGHQYPGLVAMVLAVAVCASIGLLQGSIIAFVGVPSFVVTLAGFLIWQGVILNTLEQRGTIIIQDRWINYTDSYLFSHTGGWLIAVNRLDALSVERRLQALGGARNPDRTGELGRVHSSDARDRRRRVRRGRDREPRTRDPAAGGPPALGRDHHRVLHPADVPGQVDDLRPPRLRGRR